MMKKLLIFLTLSIILMAESWAQQTPLTSSYFRNKFLYNTAYSANQIAPRFDVLYRQQWAGMEGGLSTTAFTAQLPRLQRRDTTGAVHPILMEGLGANFMITQDNVGLLSTTGFQLGATKTFEGFVMRDTLGNVLPGYKESAFSVGFSLGGYMTSVDNNGIIGRQDDRVLLDYASAKFNPDATLGLTYQKGGLEVGFSVRQLLDRGATLQESNFLTKYFNQSFFTGSYYMVLGTLDRVGLEPQIVYKFANELPGQVQFNVVADFWRDWEKGTPRMQAVVGYRTGFGANFGITVRPVPRMAVSYMYEMSMNNLNKLTQGEVVGTGGSLGLTHEIMVTYDIRHKKWSPRKIFDIPKPIEDGDTTGNGGIVEQIDTLWLEGKPYVKEDLVNDYMGQVRFEPGTAELTDDSYEALDKLAEMMLLNKAVRVEVGSHTDSLSNQFSLQLTQKRSDAVKSYLQDVKGVELGRVIPVGFGRTKQEDGKEPERTEFKLIALNDEDE